MSPLGVEVCTELCIGLGFSVGVGVGIVASDAVCKTNSMVSLSQEGRRGWMH